MANIKRANTSGITKTGTAIPDVVDAPTIGTASDVGTSRAYNNGAASVTFTPAVTGGAASSYIVTSSPGGFTGTGASSPVTVTGLSSATAYTFSVQGVNSSGTWGASSASNSATATTVPQAPTIGTATAGSVGSGQASITFTAGASGGSAITQFTATSSPGGFTGTGASSPITVSGLTAGTAYTFTVTATNANGTSTASSASNSVTPTTISFVGISESSSTNTSVYSSDGVTWTQTTNPKNATGTSWSDCTYTAGKWYACGDGNTVSYSSDGLSWTSVTAAGGTKLSAIASNGSRVIVFSSLTNFLNYSDNGGATWTGLTFGSTNATTTNNRVSYGSGYWAISLGYNNIAYSANGTSWTEKNIVTVAPMSLGTSDSLTVAYGNSRFIAACRDENSNNYTKTAYVDTNPANTWTSGGVSSAAGTWAMVYHQSAGLFVKTRVSASGSWEYSSNGVTWTTTTKLSNNLGQQLAYTGGSVNRAVTVSRTGTTGNAIGYTSNGISWTETTLPVSGGFVVGGKDSGR